MTTVSAYQARSNLAQFVELAFYKNEQIRIERNKKPMARIVGEPLMQTMDKLIDYIIRYKPALADTLAIELDDKTHERPERQNRDREVERILQDAGVPLLRLENHGRFNPSELSQKIKDALSLPKH